MNEFIHNASHRKIERMSTYSIMEDPMTSCGCFECISAILPLSNGVMIVDRDHADITPSGMKFSSLAGSVGGGQQAPGFIGHSKYYIGSRKYISAEGGFKRITWMPKRLKEELRSMLEARAEEEGISGFVDMIADETVGITEKEIMEHCTAVGHPAMEMEPMI